MGRAVFLFPLCSLYGHGSRHYEQCELLAGELMVGTKEAGAFSGPLKKAVFIIA